MKIIGKIPYLILFILSACSFHTESNINPIMKIENDNLFKDYKLSDIVDSIQIIPLETSDSCLIGDCSKVLVDNQNIYISDKISKSLFVFGLNGKLKYNIKNIGKGPTEYLEIEDFCLLNNGNFVILDGSLQKIIFVSGPNLSLAEQKVPFYSDAIEYLREGYLVFNGSSREDRIIIWNYKKKERVNSFIKYDEKYNSTRTLKPLIKYNNNVYYAHEFKTYLERISIDKIEKYNYIDFGKYNLEGDLLKQRFLGVTDIYINPPNTASIYKYTETNSLIYFRFSIENLSESPFCVFYSKETKNKIVLNNDYYTDNLTHYICPPMINTATPAGGLVSILLPSLLLEKMDQEKSKPDGLLNEDKFRQMKEKIKGIKITDNPIIAIYYLKQF
jgi:hypothetical protein